MPFFQLDINTTKPFFHHIAVFDKAVVNIDTPENKDDRNDEGDDKVGHMVNFIFEI